MPNESQDKPLTLQMNESMAGIPTPSLNEYRLETRILPMKKNVSENIIHQLIRMYQYNLAV